MKLWIECRLVSDPGPLEEAVEGPLLVPGGQDRLRCRRASLRRSWSTVLLVVSKNWRVPVLDLGMHVARLE
jgi:hypothetical protein